MAARRESKAKKRARRFVNMLIVLCLVMCGVVTVTVLYDYHRLDALLGAGEIATLLGVWGGELLLIVVRQVLGSDALKKPTQNNEEDVG
jgi:hypothetical protein